MPADERGPDEARPVDEAADAADDREDVAEDERAKELDDTARALSVANDLDTGPPRH